MGRIRTIKPEFPHSESMGRVSREARLLFILLWTLADDSGRTRAASRMLASLLFPYDDDAKDLVTGWLEELDLEGCLVRYEHEGQAYLEICNWCQHQKIDRPTPSKYPSPRESSRILASPRRALAKNSLGSRTKEGIKEGIKEYPLALASGSLEASPSKPTEKERDPLRDALAASFLAKTRAFASPAKENANLLKLAAAIRRKCEFTDLDEMEAGQSVVETFWRLHESGKQFYSDFTPSKALAILESLWVDAERAAAATDTSWIAELEAQA